MKYFILVPDGSADYPMKSLNGKTVLEAANIPYLDRLASKSLTGLVKTVPKGFEPGSDVANLSILGYDPKAYYTGRGPLEAAYHNIKVNEGQTIFRCNFVTVKNDILIDYSAGHIETTEAAELIGYLDQIISDIKFYVGLSYRHLAAVEGDFSKMKFFPPHDVLGKKLEDIYPQGAPNEYFINLFLESRKLLEGHQINIAREAEGKNPANMIWLWGGGKETILPSFENKFGKKGAVISAVDLLKGIAKKAKMEVIEVEGATGYLDTNYAGKVKAAIEASKKNDVVMVHIEAPDETGHIGKTELKIKALEDFDDKIVKPLIDNLKGEYRILVLPDHYTPLSLRTHTAEPVPFMVYDSRAPYESTAGSFSEFQFSKSGLKIKEGYKLLEEVLFV
jgi:2,3-bisphosphoglycerate-independent phosphoglycerate mutase